MVVFMPDVMHSIAKVFVACRNAWILANGDGCSVIHCQAQAAVLQIPETSPIRYVLYQGQAHFQKSAPNGLDRT